MRKQLPSRALSHLPHAFFSPAKLSHWIFAFGNLAQRLAPETRRARVFVLSYFMGDGSLSIFEPPQRNSGLPGGKFLERMKVGHCMTSLRLVLIAARCHHCAA